MLIDLPGYEILDQLVADSRSPVWRGRRKEDGRRVLLRLRPASPPDGCLSRQPVIETAGIEDARVRAEPARAARASSAQ